MLNISFEEKDLFASDAVAVLVNDQLKIDNELTEIDQKFHGLLSKTIQGHKGFTGKFGQSEAFTAIDKKGDIKTIIIVGIGDESKLKEYQIEEIGGTIYLKAKAAKVKSLSIQVNGRIGDFQIDQFAANLGSGALLASYRFDKYRTKAKEEIESELENFNIIIEDHEFSYQAFQEKKAIIMGVYFARNLTSEPANILYPESYAQQIVDQLEPIGVEVEVLGEREMNSLGMGALLGVGQGSARESKMVIMQYNGAPKEQKPVCFVGKGVTFDTGGISLKPAAGMDAMKYDMAGSAAVVGTIKALALRSAKVNAVGIIGLVENMPGANAQRPGDVVVTMSGQTVEVLNTDAEGRLVLCDCMTYLQKNFQPECIVDLATLTGAIVISLGSTYAGCFANDNDLAASLINASFATNEKLWRMPLHSDYDAMLKSPIADMANIGNEKGAAGSSTAAQFIAKFIEDGVKWAHLDIAGVAWNKKEANPICPKGAVGFGVRLLNKFVQENYESK
jgi:leucyl aminopeptidase